MKNPRKLIEAIEESINLYDLSYKIKWADLDDDLVNGIISSIDMVDKGCSEFFDDEWHDSLTAIVSILYIIHNAQIGLLRSGKSSGNEKLLSQLYESFSSSITTI